MSHSFLSFVLKVQIIDCLVNCPRLWLRRHEVDSKQVLSRLRRCRMHVYSHLELARVRFKCLGQGSFCFTVINKLRGKLALLEVFFHQFHAKEISEI